MQFYSHSQSQVSQPPDTRPASGYKISKSVTKMVSPLTMFVAVFAIEITRQLIGNLGTENQIRQTDETEEVPEVPQIPDFGSGNGTEVCILLGCFPEEVAFLIRISGLALIFASAIALAVPFTVRNGLLGRKIYSCIIQFKFKQSSMF